MTFQPPPPGGAPPPFGPGRPGYGPQGPRPGGQQPGGPYPGQYPPASGPRPPYGPYGTPPPYGVRGPGPHAPGGGYGGPAGPQGPYGPPPPRRNTGAIVAWIIGGVAAIALVALVATLVVTTSGPDESSVATDASTSSSGSPSTSPGGSTSAGDTSAPESADYASIAQIRAALQNYVAARNARDVVRMKAAVCTQSRDRITGPPPTDDGIIVLDGFLGTVFDGNVAQSEVVSHLEKGSRRTESEKSKERFLKERGSWIYCPDAEPDIGT
ncbi:hypothetical protein RD149_09360 [Gordonia westfalica]|uniref:Mce-associated membrane protein n=1 Tax=Gordonia westfalica TaxID=158898 RepID=A0ABU2GR88_9ACTN|nr:hypothetical protein [Gordonia westfalica]MDS1113976.1 hypothetical protein [Gordonia westfalica]